MHDLGGDGMSSPRPRSRGEGSREGGYARALFPDPAPSPSRSIARAAAEARKDFESQLPRVESSEMVGRSGRGGVETTPSPNTAVAELKGFTTTPPQSPPMTDILQNNPSVHDTSPMTDILNLVASDVGTTYTPGNANTSQAAANVSAIIRAAAEAAVAASTGRDKRIVRRTASTVSSQRSSAASSPARAIPKSISNKSNSSGYSLAHSPRGNARQTQPHTAHAKHTPPPSPPAIEQEIKNIKDDVSSFEQAFAALTDALPDDQKRENATSVLGEYSDSKPDADGSAVLAAREETARALDALRALREASQRERSAHGMEVAALRAAVVDAAQRARDEARRDGDANVSAAARRAFEEGRAKAKLEADKTSQVEVARAVEFALHDAKLESARNTEAAVQAAVLSAVAAKEAELGKAARRAAKDVGREAEKRMAEAESNAKAFVESVRAEASESILAATAAADAKVQDAEQRAAEAILKSEEANARAAERVQIDEHRVAVAAETLHSAVADADAKVAEAQERVRDAELRAEQAESSLNRTAAEAVRAVDESETQRKEDVTRLTSKLKMKTNELEAAEIEMNAERKRSRTELEQLREEARISEQSITKAADARVKAFRAQSSLSNKKAEDKNERDFEKALAASEAIAEERLEKERSKTKDAKRELQNFMKRTKGAVSAHERRILAVETAARDAVSTSKKEAESQVNEAMSATQKWMKRSRLAETKAAQELREKEALAGKLNLKITQLSEELRAAERARAACEKRSADADQVATAARKAADKAAEKQRNRALDATSRVARSFKAFRLKQTVFQRWKQRVPKRKAPRKESKRNTNRKSKAHDKDSDKDFDTTTDSDADSSSSDSSSDSEYGNDSKRERRLRNSDASTSSEETASDSDFDSSDSEQDRKAQTAKSTRKSRAPPHAPPTPLTAQVANEWKDHLREDLGSKNGTGKDKKPWKDPKPKERLKKEKKEKKKDPDVLSVKTQEHTKDQPDPSASAPMELQAKRMESVIAAAERRVRELEQELEHTRGETKNPDASKSAVEDPKPPLTVEDASAVQDTTPASVYPVASQVATPKAKLVSMESAAVVDDARVLREEREPEPEPEAKKQPWAVARDAVRDENAMFRERPVAAPKPTPEREPEPVAKKQPWKIARDAVRSDDAVFREKPAAETQTNPEPEPEPKPAPEHIPAPQEATKSQATLVLEAQQHAQKLLEAQTKLMLQAQAQAMAQVHSGVQAVESGAQIVMHSQPGVPSPGPLFLGAPSPGAQSPSVSHPASVDPPTRAQRPSSASGYFPRPHSSSGMPPRPPSEDARVERIEFDGRDTALHTAQKTEDQFQFRGGYAVIAASAPSSPNLEPPSAHSAWAAASASRAEGYRKMETSRPADGTFTQSLRFTGQAHPASLHGSPSSPHHGVDAGAAFSAVKATLESARRLMPSASSPSSNNSLHFSASPRMRFTHGTPHSTSAHGTPAHNTTRVLNPAAAAASLGASAMKSGGVRSGKENADGALSAFRGITASAPRRALRWADGDDPPDPNSSGAERSHFDQAPSGNKTTRPAEPDLIASVEEGVRAALTRAKAQQAADLAAEKEAEALRAKKKVENAVCAVKHAAAESHAATFLQSRARGMLQRGQYVADRGRVIAAQMCVRRWVLRRRRSRAEAKRVVAEETALAAERARQEAIAETNAATMIQAAARGFRARGKFSTEKAAMINVQMAVRRWVVRVRCARARETRLEAERLAAEAAAAAEAKAELHAVTFIQSQMRGMMVRGQYTRERAAVITVQMAVRRWVLRRRRSALEAARVAAEKTAAAAAAEKAKAEESARMHAATFIQSHIRGGAARTNAGTLRAAVVSTQMCVRRWLLRRKWSRLEAARLEAERIAAEEEAAAREAQAQLNAATMIQAAARGRRARGQYLSDRERVIQVQMSVRRWVLRVKRKRALEARLEAERIAAEAAEAKAQGNAAIFIQSRLRGAAARAKATELRLQRALNVASFKSNTLSPSLTRKPSLGTPLRSTLDDATTLDDVLRNKEELLRMKLPGRFRNTLQAEANSPWALQRARKEALDSPNLRSPSLPEKLSGSVRGTPSPRNALLAARDEALAETPEPELIKKKPSMYERFFSPSLKK